MKKKQEEIGRSFVCLFQVSENLIAIIQAPTSYSSEYLPGQLRRFTNSKARLGTVLTWTHLCEEQIAPLNAFIFYTATTLKKSACMKHHIFGWHKRV